MLALALGLLQLLLLEPTFFFFFFLRKKENAPGEKGFEAAPWLRVEDIGFGV